MIMKRKVIIVFSFFFMLVAASAGFGSLESLRHKYIMRGQILEVNGDTVYLCIGSADGAQVGQELTVYRYERTGSMSPKPSLRYKRETVGKVRIKEIDEHMARANIVSGKVRQHDVVELMK